MDSPAPEGRESLSFLPFFSIWPWMDWVVATHLWGGDLPFSGPPFKCQALPETLSEKHQKSCFTSYVGTPFSPVKLTQTTDHHSLQKGRSPVIPSDLQNRKIIHVYGFKPLSLWSFVSAAVGNRGSDPDGYALRQPPGKA